MRQGSKRGAIGFRKNGALRRGSSKVGRTDAVVDGEDGGTTTAECGERIMSGIRSGSKIIGNGRQRKVAMVDDTMVQVRGP